MKMALAHKKKLISSKLTATSGSPAAFKVTSATGTWSVQNHPLLLLQRTCKPFP